MKPERLLCVLLLGALCACTGSGVDPLRIENARVRALIPGQDKTVGYFEINNGTAADVSLIGAMSSIAEALEFHTTIRDGDMVRMRRLQQVVVPAGATIHFQPGGRHLMLFGVRSLAETNEIRLVTADGRTLVGSFRQIPIGVDK